MTASKRGGVLSEEIMMPEYLRPFMSSFCINRQTFQKFKLVMDDCEMGAGSAEYDV